MVSISDVFNLSAGISSCFAFSISSTNLSVSVNGLKNPLVNPFNISERGKTSSFLLDFLLSGETVDFTPLFLTSSDKESIDSLSLSNELSNSLLFSDNVSIDSLRSLNDFSTSLFLSDEVI